MADDSLKLEASLASMLASLSPSARKSVLKDIADKLRDTNRKRIAGQIGPDGQPFPPRLRQKKGRIRRAMFTKLRGNRWMKARASADEATVEFIGAAGRIARVHHEGLRDRVNRNGKEYTYQKRPLLGFSDTDLALIEELMVNAIAGK